MAVAITNEIRTSTELEFVSFYLGDFLMGINIQQAQEINQLLDITPVPHVPDYVAGVVNLRGQVVTVLDLRSILGLDPIPMTTHTRNVIVNAGGEQVGLIVDQIADVIIAESSEIEPPPLNLSGVDGKFFRGVYKLEGELLVILKIDEIVQSEMNESTSRQASTDAERKSVQYDK